MTPLDTKKLEQLIEEDKLDKAGAILDDFLKTDLTEAERGEIYVTIASIYMKVATRLNRDYSGYLDGAIKSLQKLDKIDNDIDDGLNLSQVRKKLK